MGFLDALKEACKPGPTTQDMVRLKEQMRLQAQETTDDDQDEETERPSVAMKCFLHSSSSNARELNLDTLHSHNQSERTTQHLPQGLNLEFDVSSGAHAEIVEMGSTKKTDIQN